MLKNLTSNVMTRVVIRNIRIAIGDSTTVQLEGTDEQKEIATSSPAPRNSKVRVRDGIGDNLICNKSQGVADIASGDQQIESAW